MTVLIVEALLKPGRTCLTSPSSTLTESQRLQQAKPELSHKK